MHPSGPGRPLVLALLTLLACDERGDTTSKAVDVTDSADSGAPDDTGTPVDSPPQRDADGDGVAAPADCDDTNPLVRPGATERCNDADDDCDGLVDVASTPFPEAAGVRYRDQDVDGFGALATAVWACDLQVVGWSDRAGDCDDGNPNVRPDAATPCAPSGPLWPPLARSFARPVPVDELNSTATDTQPTLSASGRRICFSSNRSGGRGGFDLWCAERATGSGPFGEPRVQSLTSSTANEYHPTLSADGSELFFASTRSGGADIWRATWSAPDGAFGEATRVAELSTASPDWDPALAMDGRTLVYVSGSPGAQSLRLARRPSLLEPFGEPVEVREIDAPAAFLEPALSPDGRTLLFSFERPWPGFTTPLAYQRWAATLTDTTTDAAAPVVFDDFEGWDHNGGAAATDGTLWLGASFQGVKAAPSDPAPGQVDLFRAVPLPGVVDTRGLLPRAFEAEGRGMQHFTGRRGTDAWQAVASDPAADLLLGPFTQELPAGAHVAAIRVKVDLAGSDEVPVAELVIRDHRTASPTTLATLPILHTDVPGTGWHDLETRFTSQEGSVIAFRVRFWGVVGVAVDRITVR
ncbi:MAG: PD40 domain-containing protein [Alphaproteobacteria bacterium]|nr:PD40 domain-containing protein [Alphaproteobacteria bacterium]